MSQNESQPTLYLASQSPRRRQLLEAAGYRPRLLPGEACAVPEHIEPGELGEQAVIRLAEAKARQALQWPSLPEDAVVLAGDTVVVAYGRILGKPVDRDDAVATLSRLAGTRHRVLTAISVGRLVAGEVTVRGVCVGSDVWLADLSQRQIRAYVATGEADDKAGSYAIQGLAAQFVSRIDGSCSGVTGLPLAETHALLAEFGIFPDWLDAPSTR